MNNKNNKKIIISSLKMLNLIRILTADDEKMLPVTSFNRLVNELANNGEIFINLTDLFIKFLKESVTVFNNEANNKKEDLKNVCDRYKKEFSKIFIESDKIRHTQDELGQINDFFDSYQNNMFGEVELNQTDEIKNFGGNLPTVFNLELIDMNAQGKMLGDITKTDRKLKVINSIQIRYKNAGIMFSRAFHIMAMYYTIWKEQSKKNNDETKIKFNLNNNDLKFAKEIGNKFNEILENNNLKIIEFSSTQQSLLIKNELQKIEKLASDNKNLEEHLNKLKKDIKEEIEKKNNINNIKNYNNINEKIDALINKVKEANSIAEISDISDNIRNEFENIMNNKGIEDNIKKIIEQHMNQIYHPVDIPNNNDSKNIRFGIMEKMTSKEEQEKDLEKYRDTFLSRYIPYALQMYPLESLNKTMETITNLRKQMNELIKRYNYIADIINQGKKEEKKIPKKEEIPFIPLPCNSKDDKKQIDHLQKKIRDMFAESKKLEEVSRTLKKTKTIINDKSFNLKKVNEVINTDKEILNNKILNNKIDNIITKCNDINKKLNEILKETNINEEQFKKITDKLTEIKKLYKNFHSYFEKAKKQTIENDDLEKLKSIIPNLDKGEYIDEIWKEIENIIYSNNIDSNIITSSYNLKFRNIVSNIIVADSYDNETYDSLLNELNNISYELKKQYHKFVEIVDYLYNYYIKITKFEIEFSDFVNKFEEEYNKFYNNYQRTKDIPQDNENYEQEKREYITEYAETFYISIAEPIIKQNIYSLMNIAETKAINELKEITNKLENKSEEFENKTKEIENNLYELENNPLIFNNSNKKSINPIEFPVEDYEYSKAASIKKGNKKKKK